MMRFDRFTERAQEAAQRAAEIIQRYGHNQIDTEHILLALIEQPQGVVPQILEILKVGGLPEEAVPILVGLGGALLQVVQFIGGEGMRFDWQFRCGGLDRWSGRGVGGRTKSFAVVLFHRVNGFPDSFQGRGM